MRFEGQHALITGGSSGIGLAIARELVSRGATVHLVARSPDKLAAAAAELRSGQDSAAVVAHPCDVTDASAVDELATRLVQDGTVVTVLVNSAGMTHPGYFREIEPEVFEQTMRLNFFGTLHTCRAFAPGMIDQHRGAIVNVSSVAGLMGTFGYTAYAASKFAVTGFTEALRSELLPEGVMVCLLCPPDTDTPMLEQEAALSPPETRAINEGAGVLRADEVARTLVRGLQRGQAVIVPGAAARRAVWLHRVWPGLVERVLASTVRRVRRTLD